MANAFETFVKCDWDGQPRTYFITDEELTQILLNMKDTTGLISEIAAVRSIDPDLIDEDHIPELVYKVRRMILFHTGRESAGNFVWDVIAAYERKEAQKS